MSSQKAHRSWVLAVLFALSSVLVVVLALQSMASNAQTNRAFQVAQAPTPPGTIPPATTPQTTTPPATPAAVPPTTPPSLIAGGLDIGKQATDLISSLRSILGSITDATTAQSALPRLQDVIT